MSQVIYGSDKISEYNENSEQRNFALMKNFNGPKITKDVNSKSNVLQMSTFPLMKPKQQSLDAFLYSILKTKQLFYFPFGTGYTF